MIGPILAFRICPCRMLEPKQAALLQLSARRSVLGLPNLLTILRLAAALPCKGESLLASSTTSIRVLLLPK